MDEKLKIHVMAVLGSLMSVPYMYSELKAPFKLHVESGKANMKSIGEVSHPPSTDNQDRERGKFAIDERGDQGSSPQNT